MHCYTTEQVLLVLLFGAAFCSAVDITGETLVETIPQSNPGITFAYPMERLTQNVSGSVFTMIGTDEGNCANKDASGKNVKASPTAGFLEVPFTVSDPSQYVIRGLFVAPDSMSNSMFLQFDAGAKLTYSMGKGRTPVTMLVSADGDPVSDECFYFAAGSHNVRLYVREPGAGMTQLTLSKIGQVAIKEVIGCNPCSWDTNLHLDVKLENFCGPSQFHEELIQVNGRKCAELTYSSHDELHCLVSVPPDDSGVTLSLKPASGQEAQFDTTKSSMPIPFKDVPKFPVWAIILIVLAGLAIVAGIVLFAMRNKIKTRHAPKDSTKPIAVAFFTIKKFSQFQERFPDDIESFLSICSKLVQASASAASCFVVRKVGVSSFLVVATTTQATVRFAEIVQKDFAAQNWSGVFKKQRKRKTRRKAGAAPVTSASTTGDTATSKSGSTLEMSQGDNSTRHSSSHGGTSTHSNNSSLKDAIENLRCSVAVHEGKCIISENEQTASYDYDGKPIDECAAIADLCQEGQTLVSGVAAANQAGFTFYTTVDVGADAIELFQPPFSRFELKEGAMEGGGDLAALLTQAKDGIVKKKVALLKVRVSKDDHSEVSEKNYIDLQQIFADAAANNSGHLQGSYGMTAVITFNAASSAYAPSRKAIIAALYLQNRVKTDFCGFSVACGVGSGMSFVGSVVESTAIVGGPCEEGAACLDTCLELQEKYHNDAHGVSIVAPSRISDDLTAFCFFQKVQLDDPADNKKGKIAVMSLKSATESDEWMYEMRQADSMDPFAVLNAMMALVEQGNKEEARQMLEKVKHTSESWLAQAAVGIAILEELVS